MNDFDRKLRAILATLEGDTVSAIRGSGGIKLRTFDSYSDPISYALDQIKQALIDENWIPPKASAGFRVRYNIMKGQEWYDRFMRELPPTGLDSVYVEGTKSKNWSIPWDSINKAAKKASGLPL